mgnify:CR=1 FL=1
MITTKAESDKRKATGKAFQDRHRRAVLNAFQNEFPELTGNDISSCPSCQHGEDIKLSEYFRSIYAVSTECKSGASKYKELYREYYQAVKQTNSLAIADDIIPQLTVQGSNNEALVVVSESDWLNVMVGLAVLKKGATK